MWTKYGAFLMVLAVGCGSIGCNNDSPTQPSCTFALSPSSLSFGASGGSSSVTVTTASNCTWTAASDRGWMSITGGGSGIGSGAVSVSVTANPSEAARTGTLTIGGERYEIVQTAR